MKKLGKPDKLDRYRQHLLEGRSLKNDELQMLAKYRKVSALMCIMTPRKQIIRVLEEDFGVSESHSYAIIRDSIKLYGDVNEADLQGLRYISYEQFMLAANLARKDGDYNAMIRALEKAAELYDLFSPTKSGTDPKKFMIPVGIVFTTDAAVLKEETEDVAHEELP